MTATGHGEHYRPRRTATGHGGHYRPWRTATGHGGHYRPRRTVTGHGRHYRPRRTATSYGGHYRPRRVTGHGGRYRPRRMLQAMEDTTGHGGQRRHGKIGNEAVYRSIHLVVYEPDVHLQVLLQHALAARVACNARARRRLLGGAAAVRVHAAHVLLEVDGERERRTARAAREPPVAVAARRVAQRAAHGPRAEPAHGARRRRGEPRGAHLRLAGVMVHQQVAPQVLGAHQPAADVALRTRRARLAVHPEHVLVQQARASVPPVTRRARVDARQMDARLVVGDEARQPRAERVAVAARVEERGRVARHRRRRRPPAQPQRVVRARAAHVAEDARARRARRAVHLVHRGQLARQAGGQRARPSARRRRAPPDGRQVVQQAGAVLKRPVAARTSLLARLASSRPAHPPALLLLRLHGKLLAPDVVVVVVFSVIIRAVIAELVSVTASRDVFLHADAVGDVVDIVTLIRSGPAVIGVDVYPTGHPVGRSRP